MTSRSTSAGKLTAREIAELALICALMVAGKEALRVIPNVHPITLLILLCVRVYGVDEQVVTDGDVYDFTLNVGW